MKRILSVILAASMLTGLLAGCSSGQKPAASTEGTGTVASAEESTTAAEKAESTAAICRMQSRIRLRKYYIGMLEPNQKRWIRCLWEPQACRWLTILLKV